LTINKKIANYLQRQLNALGREFEPNCKFRISADLGDIKKNTREIQGILNVKQSVPISQITNFISFTVKYRLDMYVPKDEEVIKIHQYNAIMERIVGGINGKSIKLEEGTALFTVSIPNAHDLGVHAGIGKDVISTLHIDVLYSEGAITSANQSLKINGNAVLFSAFSVRLQTEGAVNSIFGKVATQTLPIRQTKLYDIIMPYIADNPVCLEIQKDILSGDMVKTYTLEYSDGAAYPANKPYIATVSLFQNNLSGVVVPSVGSFELTLTDADNGLAPGWQCEMTLLDMVFDNSTPNTLFFENRQQQLDYFASKIPATHIPSATPIRAPNLNSLSVTQQVYLARESENMLDLLNRNFAWVTVREPNGKTHAFFYGVTNATVGANNQILYDLEMDTVQTFMFRDAFGIEQCVINRAHLDRFIDT